MARCVVTDCTREMKYTGKGWCQTHYHRWWRTGTIEVVPKELPSQVTYRAAHSRISRLWGEASNYPCIECCSPANEWAYDGTDPEENQEDIRGQWPVVFSPWPEFYMPLCFPCHRLRDRSAWSDRRTHFGCGHLITSDNTYTPPSRNEKVCRTCKAEDGKARYQSKKRASNWNEVA